MYPSTRTSSLKTQPGSIAVGLGRTQGFRPVALPALAAAVHVSAASVRAARPGAGRITVRIPHEDEPAE